MYKVLRTEEFERKIEKFLSIGERLRIDKIEQELAEEGFTGKPLGYSFFREKRINGKRVYFLICDELKIVLMASISDKKKQQKTIDEIKAHLLELRKAVEEKAKLI